MNQELNVFVRSAWRFVGVSLATIALTGLIFVPIAPTNASMPGARINAAVLFDDLRANGWNVRDAGSVGLLAQGGIGTVATTLYAGKTYKIAAAGCEDAYDVDVAVLDEDGNFIDRDVDEEKLAVADIKPRWTGTFYVLVKLHRSTHNGAHVVVQYAYR